MGLFLDFLTLPVLGAPRLVHWMAKKVTEETERELLDEDRVRAQLLELQTHYDLGEITEEEYDEQESILMERLNAIREAKAERGRQ